MGAIGMDIAFDAMIGHKGGLLAVDLFLSLAGAGGYGNDAHAIS